MQRNPNDNKPSSLVNMILKNFLALRFNSSKKFFSALYADFQRSSSTSKNKFQWATAEHAELNRLFPSLMRNSRDTLLIILQHPRAHLAEIKLDLRRRAQVLKARAAKKKKLIKKL